MDAAEDVDVRWSANLHYKMSLPLELRGSVDDACEHINKAAAQLKYLTKQARGLPTADHATVRASGAGRGTSEAICWARVTTVGVVCFV